MVISVASQKGGTGKTSTSVSLAAGLAHKGKRVLLIDIDSQANSSKVRLRHYAEITKAGRHSSQPVNPSPRTTARQNLPRLRETPGSCHTPSPLLTC